MPPGAAARGAPGRRARRLPELPERVRQVVADSSAPAGARAARSRRRAPGAARRARGRNAGARAACAGARPRGTQGSAPRILAQPRLGARGAARARARRRPRRAGRRRAAASPRPAAPPRACACPRCRARAPPRSARRHLPPRRLCPDAEADADAWWIADLARRPRTRVRRPRAAWPRSPEAVVAKGDVPLRGVHLPAIARALEQAHRLVGISRSPPAARRRVEHDAVEVERLPLAPDVAELARGSPASAPRRRCRARTAAPSS